MPGVSAASPEGEESERERTQSWPRKTRSVRGLPALLLSLCQWQSLCHAICVAVGRSNFRPINGFQVPARRVADPPGVKILQNFARFTS